ncbi:hypothetical protein FMM75_05695 [Lachnospiraceae bacterium MD335]|nr:hypothetical protein [Lachnospiraceae bacterium MD335]
MKKGIDIAKWNKITDYKAARNAGVQFAIVKVIDSCNKPDSRFHEHVSGLDSAGIPITGGYTYSYANTVDKAKKAADAFVETAKPKGIDTMWLDLEDNAVKGLGSSIVNIINAYKMFADSANMDFGIYTGAQYYNPYLKPCEKEIADIPIWWARYPYTKERTITADVPDSKYLPTGMELYGWQYSSKGIISGIDGYVDLNVWYKKEPMENTEREIPTEYNPFTEPMGNVAIGKTGNDASWVQWYLWRFGKLTNGAGQPDAAKINGVFDVETKRQVREVQTLLRLAADGIVGKITRATWKKMC